MRLFMVEERSWGTVFTLVRAESKDDAIRVAKGDPAKCDVTELNPDEDTILWSWELEHDSRRDD